MTCYADFHFHETIFSLLGGEKPIPKERHEIIYNALTLTCLDPHTNQCELEVQKIIHSQGLASQLSYAFTNGKKAAKSFILTINIPAWIDVPKRKLNNEYSKAHLKHCRPVGSKDSILHKRKTQRKHLKTWYSRKGYKMTYQF